ncbi:hypothetical protein [Sphaerospermopsis sp. LEGE 08334]|jgi:hypothetical protein|uniref:hypothetical protein n=1 Tax=Sphaerospermopsis sp. LEGE 08334 TaxID=1828651 RepID=UPI00188239DE|nr:hypothetical protein [Sphaerospermopsis sp. LEGE 08334]MBE9054725.1 hypothetical protein [Sphaerospermopsis sp. LEGE 08334]
MTFKQESLVDELEQKIYQTLLDRLPNDDDFTKSINNLLTLLERVCSEKAEYHHQNFPNEQFNYWHNFQQEIHQLKILKQQERIKSYRGKLQWEDNLEEKRIN